MKKIVSILLCFIIPFCFVIPADSYAFDVQGTEYSEPGLLPPNIDCSQYDYYFLTVSGTPENPRYLLYFIKDNSEEKHNRLYFDVTLQPYSTRICIGKYTGYGVTTNYSTSIKSYNLTSGTWSNSVDSSNHNQFVFDSYSNFTSSCKYIIGSNSNIYSYSGSLVRAGDYDDLNLFFLGGLWNSSEVTENLPPETTTSGGSDTGGGVNVDLSSITDLLNIIINKFTSNVDSITSLVDSITSLVDSVDSLVNGDSSSDGSIFLHLSVIKNTLVDFLNSSNTKLDEIKQEILNFERYFSEFSAVNGEIANIFSVLSGLNSNIVNIHTKLMEIKEIFNGINNNVSNINTGFSNFLLRFPSDFEDTINSIKSNVSSINTGFSNFLLNFPADFKDIINSIQSYLSLIYVALHNFCLNFPTDFKDTINSIKSNVSSINNNIKTDFDGLINHIQTSFDSFFNDISLKIGNLTDSEIINAIKAVETAVNNLPENIEEILKYLFIPTTEKPKELMEIVNNHFGFARQFAKMSDVIFNPDNFDNKAPEYIIKFDSDLFGSFEGKIIDFSIIPYDYIFWFRQLVSGITWYFFIQKVRKRLPAIFNGEAFS